MQAPPLPVESLQLPDGELGLELWAWWLAYQASKRGVSLDEITDEFGAGLINATLGMDTDQAPLAGLEKALLRAAKGDMDNAGKLFRDWTNEKVIARAALDEVNTGRRRQRANARKPRKDALQRLIDSIVTENPDIETPEVLQQLRTLERGDVIDAIRDDEGIIEWKAPDGRAEETKFSALKDRVSRARKKPESR